MPLAQLSLASWHDAEPVSEGAGGPLQRGAAFSSRSHRAHLPSRSPGTQLACVTPRGAYLQQVPAAPSRPSSTGIGPVSQGGPACCSRLGHVRHSLLQAAAQGMSSALQPVAFCPPAQPTGPGHRENFPARAGHTQHRPQFAGGVCGRRSHPRVSVFTPTHLEGALPHPWPVSSSYY